MMSVEVNTTDASAGGETLVSAVAIAGAPDFVRNGAGGKLPAMSNKSPT